MKRALIVFAIAAAVVGCKETGPEGSFTGDGTIHRGVGPECPDTWHVATGDGTMLWPVIDGMFHVEGMHVKFVAHATDSAVSTCQAGTIVEFISMKKQ